MPHCLPASVPAGMCACPGSRPIWPAMRTLLVPVATTPCEKPRGRVQPSGRIGVEAIPDVLMIVVSSWENEPPSSLGARHAATTALLVAHEGRRRRCRSGSAFGGEQVLEPDREATNAHAGGMPNRVGDGAGCAGDG